MQWHSPCSSVMLGNDTLCQSLLLSHAVPQVNCLLTRDSVSRPSSPDSVDHQQWVPSMCEENGVPLLRFSSSQPPQYAREQGQNDVSHSLTLSITTTRLWLTPRQPADTTDHHNKQENCDKNGAFSAHYQKKERCLRVTPGPPNQTQRTINSAYLHHNGKLPFGGWKMCQKTGQKQCVSCSFNTAWTVRCLDRLLNNQLLTPQTINCGWLHHNMPQNWGKKVQFLSIYTEQWSALTRVSETTLTLQHYSPTLMKTIITITIRTCE